jgi:RNA ligase
MSTTLHHSRPLLSTAVSIRDLAEAVEQGYVSRRMDPTNTLAIYNYTPKTQYERNWTPVTRLTRGLITCPSTTSQIPSSTSSPAPYITASRGERIISRPFLKFHNFSELPPEQIPTRPPDQVTEKMDGSLGILYPHPEGAGCGYAIATRGSFQSDQAIWATEYLNRHFPTFTPDPDTTYLFEIIYPQNRIVVDYGARQMLVLIALIRNSDGADIPVDSSMAYAAGWHGEFVETRPLALPETYYNTEGVVALWRNENGPGLRLKMKHPEYIRLHTQMFRLSSKVVWEAVRRGALPDLLKDVPDEVYPWVERTAALLLLRHDARMEEIIQGYNAFSNSVDDLESDPQNQLPYRTVFAQRLRGHPDASYYFNLLDARDDALRERVWRILEPPFSTPFDPEDS